ncbi:hypothetical protein TRVA0_054S00232 [Trichomonascus vanleenenianus]|uniref:uncharacterized protein n=1 Tax=Trichomonascus vanleenenianus TaxID=2268995 RepID=UPI003ECA561A
MENYTKKLVWSLVDHPPDPPEAEQALQTIKENGRKRSVSCALGVEELSRLVEVFVLDKRHASHGTMTEALTIVANALVLNEGLLGRFEVPHDLISKVLSESIMASAGDPEQYLLMRLLFLFTFCGQPLATKTVQTCLTVCGARIKAVADSPKFACERDKLAFVEALKTLFNLLHHYPDPAVHFVQGYTANDLVRVLLKLPHRLDSLVLYRHICHNLLCLPVSVWLYERDDATEVLTTVFDFLELLTHPDNDEDTVRQDQILSPPLSLVHSIVTDLVDHQHLPAEAGGYSMYPELVATVRSRVLPSDKDREKALGESDSLSSYLLKITIDPMLTTSRNIIFDIFWKVSHENADDFVANFGLGFASSFLASHGIAFPESVTMDPAAAPRSSAASSAASSSSATSAINPITGQLLRFQRPPSPPLEEMTEEEKERDAERLYVLFERLKANKVFQVENPVHVAARNGQL